MAGAANGASHAAGRGDIADIPGRDFTPGSRLFADGLEISLLIVPCGALADGTMLNCPSK
jgi:hypothetical protein